VAIFARLLRGEPLELVARETNVSIARLTEWRERALAGAATALKERERDDRDESWVRSATVWNAKASRLRMARTAERCCWPWPKLC
jgi:hypothetical protein